MGLRVLSKKRSEHIEVFSFWGIQLYIVEWVFERWCS
jgi:hypothetical protein